MRLVLLGGFLGSGKTTLIRNLSRKLLSLGYRVGIITNDQAQGLVDTIVLQSSGVKVEEVPGGCFCCQFQDLVGKVRTIAQQADILFCEPVGSCTDVVATVVNPLKAFYSGKFEIAPLIVLAEPKLIRELSLGGSPRSFSDEIGYLFDKQLEEAEIIALNKLDTVSSEDLRELEDSVQKLHPRKTVLTISALRGDGLDRLLTSILNQKCLATALLDIDYDRYAKGEATLGWLNATASLTGAPSFNARLFIQEMMSAVQTSLRASNLQVAHVKLVLRANHLSVWSNLSAGSQKVTYGGEDIDDVTHATIVLNARVQADPKILTSLVTRCFTKSSRKTGSIVRMTDIQSFSPPYPKPLYRMAGLSSKEAFRQFRTTLEEMKQVA